MTRIWWRWVYLLVSRPELTEEEEVEYGSDGGDKALLQL